MFIRSTLRCNYEAKFRFTGWQDVGGGKALLHQRQSSYIKSADENRQAAQPSADCAAIG